MDSKGKLVCFNKKQLASSEEAGEGRRIANDGKRRRKALSLEVQPSHQENRMDSEGNRFDLVGNDLLQVRRGDGRGRSAA